MFIIDPEDTRFIAVKDHGFTVFLDIATGRFKIGKGGLRFHKQQVHQTTGGIVDIDQCRTGPTPVFKPVMVTAVNLYQLASTGPPVTGLMNFRCALSSGEPESGLYPCIATENSSSGKSESLSKHTGLKTIAWTFLMSHK